MELAQRGLYTPGGYFPYQPVELEETVGSIYGDIRIDRRLSSILSSVQDQQKLSLHQLGNSLAEQKAYYRLMKNEKLEIEKMLSELVSRSMSSASVSHMLLVQDTSKFLYNHMKGRLIDSHGLGRLQNKNLYGYWLHPSMGLNAEGGFPLGIYDAQIWTNADDLASYEARKGQALAYGQKSSSRWSDSVIAVRNRVDPSTRITSVADREADIYESMCEIVGAGCDFLIRSQHNRNISQSPAKLFDYLAQLPEQARLKLSLRADPRSGRIAKREATLALKFGPATLIRGRKAQSSNYLAYPPNLPLYVIDLQEVSASSKPIHWRLLTTHVIESVAQAKQMIQFYRQRWQVEQLFRTMKKKGLQTESIELERGPAIIRMGVIALEAALRIMQMDQAAKDPEDFPIDFVFSPLQIQCLKLICNKYEGKTQKQKNPYAPSNLKWGVWVIARLGGWKGYASQHRAGPKTFRIGWQKFIQMFEAFELIYNP